MIAEVVFFSHASEGINSQTCDFFNASIFTTEDNILAATFEGDTVCERSAQISEQECFKHLLWWSMWLVSVQRKVEQDRCINTRQNEEIEDKLLEQLEIGNYAKAKARHGILSFFQHEDITIAFICVEIRKSIFLNGFRIASVAKLSRTTKSFFGPSTMISSLSVNLLTHRCYSEVVNRFRLFLLVLDIQVRWSSCMIN